MPYYYLPYTSGQGLPAFAMCSCKLGIMLEMPFTILHTADLHLGKSFRRLSPERAEQRRADQLATLMRLCHRAYELHVDLLCIAGDLFDQPCPPTALTARVREALGDASVPVLLIPGNHDPLTEKSPYVSGRWPGNVSVAEHAGWQRIKFPTVEAVAFGYTAGETHRSPWQTFPGCGSETLVALHAACLTAGLISDAGYFPFTAEEIPPCGYVALGHHHRAVQVSNNPLAWYAGPPEPLEPEVIRAAALLVNMDNAGASVTPYDVATRRHHQVTIDVNGRRVDDIWDRALAAAKSDDLLTLRLSGVLAPTEMLDITSLRAELSTRCFAAEVITDDLHLTADITAQTGVLGALQQLAGASLAELAPQDPQRVKIERAVRYAMLALEGKL